MQAGGASRIDPPYRVLAPLCCANKPISWRLGP